MPSLKVHCAISKKRTGYGFEELHRWIDNPQKKHGINHRNYRHAFNEKDAEKIKKYWDKKKGYGWGKKAIVEWLFHIAMDNTTTAFKMSKQVYGVNTYNYFELGLANSGYIHFNFNSIHDKEMDEMFEFFEKNNNHEEESFLGSVFKKIFG